jgi:hypothetical protein
MESPTLFDTFARDRPLWEPFAREGPRRRFSSQRRIGTLAAVALVPLHATSVSMPHATRAGNRWRRSHQKTFSRDWTLGRVDEVTLP